MQNGSCKETGPWNSWLSTGWYTREQLRQLVTQIHRSNPRAYDLEVDFARNLPTYRARVKENSKGVFFFEKRLIRSGRRGREIESSIPGTGFSARGDNNEVSVFRNDANRSLVDQREPTRSLPLSSFAISRPFPGHFQRRLPFSGRFPSHTIPTTLLRLERNASLLPYRRSGTISKLVSTIAKYLVLICL